MPKPVSEQVVVVTGASSGIGRATAQEFALRGAKVVAAARNEEALGTLVEEITTGGGQALAVPTDVAEASQVHALAARAAEQFGRIDTWVNNAAVSIYGRVEELTDEEFARVLTVNFLGQVYGARAALPHLKASGDGVLIGVGSVESYRAVPLQAPYVASKFALRGFYDTLRMELLDEGAPVAVSLVLPAGINTPLFDHARSRFGRRPRVPPPVYQPEEVAHAIARAAVQPTREVPVGGAAYTFLLSQRVAPALTDAALAVGRVGFRIQFTDEPDDGRDNLDAPLPGPGRVRGSQPGPHLEYSPVTRLVSHLPRPGELLQGVVASARRRSSGS